MTLLLPPSPCSWPEGPLKHKSEQHLPGYPIFSEKVQHLPKTPRAAQDGPSLFSARSAHLCVRVLAMLFPPPGALFPAFELLTSHHSEPTFSIPAWPSSTPVSHATLPAELCIHCPLCPGTACQSCPAVDLAGEGWADHGLWGPGSDSSSMALLLRDLEPITCHLLSTLSSRWRSISY